jgi:hypothetical protein
MNGCGVKPSARNFNVIEIKDGEERLRKVLANPETAE